MTVQDGFPEHVDRLNIAIKDPPVGPPCPKCGKPTFMRTYVRPGISVPALHTDGKRIVEYRCTPCNLNYDIKTLIPLCDHCKEPVTSMYEIRSETTTDSYKLVDGKFIYDGGDVDTDDPQETLHDNCSEYPGDEVVDWFHDKVDGSLGDNH